MKAIVNSERNTIEQELETANSVLPSLPRQPLVRIRPKRSHLAIDLGDLWRYRELLYFLTWRDLKVRYKQTVLGVAWAVIQPLFTMLIFTMFFGKLAGVPSENVPYPVFVYAGLLIWTFFANAVNSSSNSLVANSNLLTKVYFPRILVPAAAVTAGLADILIAFVVMIGLMLYYGVLPSWSLVALPLPLALTTVLASGVGIWLAALNVKYRDIRFAVPFLIQLWMFLSPVIYPTTFVPQKWRWLLALNPLTGIIDSFRTSLFGHRAFSWDLIAISAVVTLAVTVCGLYTFWRTEESFADII